MQAKPLSLAALAVLLRKHTGACGDLGEGPERFCVACSATQAMQVFPMLGCPSSSRHACFQS